MSHNQAADLLSLQPMTLRCTISNVVQMVKNTRQFGNSRPLWSLVGYTFGVGATSAYEICDRAGLYGDQLVNRKTSTLIQKPEQQTP